MPEQKHYEQLGIARDGDVVTVTMRERGRAMHTELSRVFAELRADPCRVVVLTGEGEHFLGAVNLAEYVATDEQAWQQSMREARWIVRDALDLPQPLVVALNGDGIGLGASLMSLADIVVAAEGCVIGESHVEMGIAAGDGGTLTFPFLLGIHRAKRFFLLNERITVEELHELGVVTAVVPRAELAAATAEVVEKLLAMPSAALQWTKASVNRVLQLSAFMGVDSAIGHEGWSWHLAPAREGTEALRRRSLAQDDEPPPR
ncbi:enoyl-CoA hydratase/isomerase family protein [Pseudonocardia ailaonensis]|uniref:Enoyl-CoA hydratase/isomerase family protein n=1 Tax=Pseudonocardia ailaonensis TaxID=367279 RepID=A0ABN2NH63_9PSEU